MAAMRCGFAVFLSHDQVIITFCRIRPLIFQTRFFRQQIVLRERRACYIAGPPQLLQASRSPTFGSTFHISMADRPSPVD